MHRTNHIQVVLQRQIRIHAPHHMNLGDGLVELLPHPGLDLFPREGIGVGVPGSTIERAELAELIADVGGIDVLIDVVIGQISVETLPYLVGEIPHCVQVGMFVQEHAVFPAQSLAVIHLPGNLPQAHALQVLCRDHPCFPAALAPRSAATLSMRSTFSTETRMVPNRMGPRRSPWQSDPPVCRTPRLAASEVSCRHCEGMSLGWAVSRPSMPSSRRA